MFAVKTFGSAQDGRRKYLLASDLYEKNKEERADWRAIRFDHYLAVIHRDEGYYSFLEMRAPIVEVDIMGNIYPDLGLIQYGPWADARIADQVLLDMVF